MSAQWHETLRSSNNNNNNYNNNDNNNNNNNNNNNSVFLYGAMHSIGSMRPSSLRRNRWNNHLMIYVQY